MQKIHTKNTFVNAIDTNDILNIDRYIRKET